MEQKYTRELCEYLNLFEKNNKPNGYDMRDFPKNIEKNRIGLRRELQNDILQKTLSKLYENTKILKKRNESGGHKPQEKYHFTNEFKNIFFRGVEVSARMITQNNISDKLGYFTSRVGDIRFKGKMKEIMDDLLERCSKELDVTKINSTAMYAKTHKKFGVCNWECEKMACDRHQNIFDGDKSQTTICYYYRQHVGQEVIPFIDKKSDRQVEESIITKDTNYVFDNMFLTRDCQLDGIKRMQIDPKEQNFLDAVSQEPCNALISFHLAYVGVTSGGMNLYLDPGQQITYCTASVCDRNIKSATEYLENYVYSNKWLALQLKNLSGIDLGVGETKRKKSKILETKKRRLRGEEDEEKKKKNKILSDDDEEDAKKKKKNKIMSDDEEEDSKKKKKNKILVKKRKILSDDDDEEEEQKKKKILSDDDEEEDEEEEEEEEDEDESYDERRNLIIDEI